MPQLQHSIFMKLALLKIPFRIARWKVAQYWLNSRKNVDVIGVAGSVGKTTTKEIIAAVLSSTFPTIKTEANWDPIFNLPMSALKVQNNCKFVAELGIDGAGQMDKYLTLVHPKVAVLTRLSLEHVDKEHFGTYENAVNEELRLLDTLSDASFAILNGDDTLIREKCGNYPSRSNSPSQRNKPVPVTLFYGFDKNCNVRISDFHQTIKQDRVHTTFKINFKGSNFAFGTQLLGKHNALACAAAFAVGTVFNVPYDAIHNALAKIEPVNRRLNLKKSHWGYVLDDTYNASPAAVEAAVDVLVDIDKKGVMVLGDMLELGDYAVQAHKEAGEYARKKGVSAVAAYGKWAKNVLEGYGGNVRNSITAESKNQIVEWLKKRKDKTILVKGSKSMHMEEVVGAIC